MQPVIREREYKGVIDERQHWLDEIAAHKDKDDDQNGLLYCARVLMDKELRQLKDENQRLRKLLETERIRHIIVWGCWLSCIEKGMKQWRCI